MRNIERDDRDAVEVQLDAAGVPKLDPDDPIAVLRAMNERLSRQLAGAVGLLREARFYVDARATGSVKAAKLLDRIDAALPPIGGPDE